MGEPSGSTAIWQMNFIIYQCRWCGSSCFGKIREYPVQERVLMQPLRSECVQKEMLFPIWKYKAINENMRKKSFSGIFHNTMPVKVDKAAFRL